jgi:predicted membrane-bound spermidine synthase
MNTDIMKAGASCYVYGQKVDNVLVLGGGGLAVREILKYKDVKHVTL